MTPSTDHAFSYSWFINGPNVIIFQALPDDLKTKLSIDDDFVSSPKEALSRASADRRSKHLNRYFSVFIITYFSERKEITEKGRKGNGVLMKNSTYINKIEEHTELDGFPRLS